ncbi:hypothetical protein CEXT_393891 [Caerostris extrusa]|uniref:Uncharacterized protein n=1 Tax=Caerostris extrusa TaxID=172846 RepID=A0AAV4RLG5_CAEEX|nr:hypothetical protein CEXT_393891 [Caerostris extrusa]
MKFVQQPMSGDVRRKWLQRAIHQTGVNLSTLVAKDRTLNHCDVANPHFSLGHPASREDPEGTELIREGFVITLPPGSLVVERWFQVKSLMFGSRYWLLPEIPWDESIGLGNL